MKSIRGKWKIIKMSEWDIDYIDLIEPGCIEFDDENLGRFVFGTVFTGIDYRVSESDGTTLVEFSFDGDNEGEPISGRAKLTLNAEQLKGKIFLHC